MEPFIGMIALFGFNFAPRGWQQCNGQILSIAQNTALFSLLGTTYGGNGQVTFALPDLRGRFPVHAGQGQGLPNIQMGDVGGSPSVTLTVQQLPSHTHTASSTLFAESAAGSAQNPQGNMLSGGQNFYAPPAPQNNRALNNQSITTTIDAAGGNQSVTILPPYVGVNFCIAVEGIFPSRN